MRDWIYVCTREQRGERWPSVSHQKVITVRTREAGLYTFLLVSGLLRHNFVKVSLNSVSSLKKKKHTETAEIIMFQNDEMDSCLRTHFGGSQQC